MSSTAVRAIGVACPVRAVRAGRVDAQVDLDAGGRTGRLYERLPLTDRSRAAGIGRAWSDVLVVSVAGPGVATR